MINTLLISQNRINQMKKTILISLRRQLAAIAAVALFSLLSLKATAEEVPVFITIGQSNADGSAMFDPELDADMKQWYESPANTGRMKIWYRSSQVENQESNALGQKARWVVDGAVTDFAPGWMNLWYRNEQANGRTAMNMIHSYGTYSTGEGHDCAQGRRGMEPSFGREFLTAFPESELYIIKLGVSGSFISAWADPADDTNWNYFVENMFRPAIADLLSKGKQPRLAGVWWMQGCGDAGATKEYYETALRLLIDRIHNELGFPEAKIYIGEIVKPGESDITPDGSRGYGQGVRDAQMSVAASVPGVELVPTKDFALQYEEYFNGYIHFSHAGVNAIGRELARRVIADGKDNWAVYKPAR